MVWGGKEGGGGVGWGGIPALVRDLHSGGTTYQRS